MANRVVTGTVSKKDTVTFNEISIEGDLPDRLLLVAIDTERGGIHLWIPPYNAIAGVAKEQVQGYSVAIPHVQIDSPPPELGESWFIPANRFSPERWSELCTARTRGLKKAGEEVLTELFGV